jgi:hypothetical protein
VNDSNSSPRRFDARSGWSAAVVSLTIGVIGCSGGLKPVVDRTTWSVILPVKMIDAAGNAIQINGPTHASARLGSIPGTVFGNPQPPFISLKLSPDLTLQIDLNRLREIGEQATTITAQGIESGWNVVPTDTRFSRVSTNFEYQGSQANRTGLADATSGNTLLLVFFDRPCRLTGTIHTPSRSSDFSKYVFDVAVGKAGFYWLSIEKNRAGDSAVVRRASASVQPIYLVRY